MKTKLKPFIWLLLVLPSLVISVSGQAIAPATTPSSWAENIIVPPSRPLAFHIRPIDKPVEITGVTAIIQIQGQIAITQIDIALKNDSDRRQEAQIVMPAPDKAVVRNFTFEGPGKEPSAVVLPVEEARRIYNQIVAQVRDPALLEFIGYNLIQSSVFPVEPHGTQKIRLTYEHIMEKDGSRYDYILPRSESLENNIPWDIQLTIQADKPISTVYSASHTLELNQDKPKRITAKVKKSSRKDPGAFRLSYLLEGDAISASLICYPDPKAGGGYFLLLAGLPADLTLEDKAAIKREVTVVIDRSGSMRGEKLKQTQEAASQIIDALARDEAFNIITYQNVAEMFSEAPLPCTQKNIKAALEFIETIQPVGGTNIYDALQEALRQKPSDQRLGMVLFLTDGLPTVGRTLEADIRTLAADHNPWHRRVFTFGVGLDVNAPLLDKLAESTRASSTFVLPDEDVEVKVGHVFKKLAGPVFADPEMKVASDNGNRTTDVLPARMPDLFEGDQLILLGKYQKEEPLTFTFSGNYLGQQRSFEFNFNLDKATTRNAFVPRLWAARKIAELIDAVRQLGGQEQDAASNTKVKELIDEIVRLSTEHGILTEYTAFLAREGSIMETHETVLAATENLIELRAMNTRYGMGAINQSVNLGRQKQEAKLNYSNRYYDMDMNEVSTQSVQQINDRAFYKNNNQWTDSRLANRTVQPKADKVVEFGTDEFFKLAGTLAGQNRQGSIALRGEILLEVDGQVILVKNPG